MVQIYKPFLLLFLPLIFLCPCIYIWYFSSTVALGRIGNDSSWHQRTNITVCFGTVSTVFDSTILFRESKTDRNWISTLFKIDKWHPRKSAFNGSLSRRSHMLLLLIFRHSSLEQTLASAFGCDSRIIWKV